MNLKAKKIYHHLTSELSLANSESRRSILNGAMDELSSKSINCFSCTGKCCTFISNSMQTDAIQTLELYLYLQEQGMWNDELILELKEVVRNNRLDYEIQTGLGSSFRRTYTCPFYNKGPKGCSIAPESKPFGCLAFNPVSECAQGGESCASDIPLLQEREDSFEQAEEKSNEYLKKIFSFHWDKLPMPVALLEMGEKLKEL
ncbi:hypothetical protein A9Q84_18775 [Halobacteriovorax marinus]|uniref:Zinc/iron-chelating domain-containing protein n=1 Tax=Halobacteriovorax marinus TaxID=97084 RepID=A0A1Y5F7Z5_9BACT|nr:hypothetical protein A9Q84_18775 [Halobacteriovorax marinus]